MSKKSVIQIAKDEIMDNIMNQQGMYDMYYLGCIDTIESYVYYIDKDFSIAFLKRLTESSDASETIKNLANDLIEKYRKEPKLEL